MPRPAPQIVKAAPNAILHVNKVKCKPAVRPCRKGRKTILHGILERESKSKRQQINGLAFFAMTAC